MGCRLRIAAFCRELCSSAGMGRGWATVCGFECSAPPCRWGALWCSISWPRCGTRYANCVRCAQTTATSQSTKRAARAGHELCAPRHCIGAAAGGPPTAWSTLALPTANHTRSVAAARLLAALHKAPSMPAEDGGEANPGSKGGAGGRRLTAGDMDGFASPLSSACATRHDRQLCAGCSRRTVRRFVLVNAMSNQGGGWRKRCSIWLTCGSPGRNCCSLSAAASALSRWPACAYSTASA